MRISADLFIPICLPNNDLSLLGKANFSSATELHPLCKIAAEDLQAYLEGQNHWTHNFGLSDNSDGNVIGKMFGVLVVITKQNDIGYLAAFSGKLAGGNHHSRFVPPVFDALTNNSFLNTGMLELNLINREIAQLKNNFPLNSDEIEFLKSERRDLSITLQNKLFANYNFLNSVGEVKNLIAIFHDSGYKNPPSGAGECAAPKLLQYAFMNNFKPIAMAEFWWGLSPKSDTWKHGHFYTPCKEKCEPILKHMLEGFDDFILT